MKRSCLMAATLLVSLWVFAQGGSPPGQQPSTQTSSEATAGDRTGQTIEGCLAGSGGSFTLTESSGKTYQLAGDTAKLGEHVGHMLRISGSEKNAGADPSGGSSSASAQPTFTVQKVKMVSASCPTSK